jgi:hypothetical protein
MGQGARQRTVGSEKIACPGHAAQSVVVTLSPLLLTDTEISKIGYVGKRSKVNCRKGEIRKVPLDIRSFPSILYISDKLHPIVS